jgi:hypothetical protein
MSPEAQHIVDTLEEGEPVFILRGNDALAGHAILAWLSQARGSGVNRDKRESAWRVLAEMHDWRRDHGAKMPD